MDTFVVSIGIFLLVIGSSIINNQGINEKIEYYALFISLCTFIFYFLQILSIKIIHFSILIVVLLPLLMVYYFGFTIAILFTIASFISLIYTDTLFTNKIILRNNIFLKPISISLVWTILGLIIPLYYSENSFDQMLILNALNIFAFIFILCLLCDKEDVKQDKNAGLITLPLKYQKLIDLLIPIFLILLIIFQLFLKIDFIFQLVNIITIALLLLYIINFKKRKKMILDLSIGLMGGLQILANYI